MGHEGRGSALAALRRRGWATALTAGVGSGGLDSSSVAAALFRVSVTLTSRGLARWPAAAALVHRYIGVVRGAGPPKWVYDEVRKLRGALWG